MSATNGPSGHYQQQQQQAPYMPSPQQMQQQQQQQQQQHFQQQMQQQQLEQMQQANAQQQQAQQLAQQQQHVQQRQQIAELVQAAVPAMYTNVAKPNGLNHQRSISLGLNLHQLPNNALTQNMVPASADDRLQTFEWPPAAMNAGPASGQLASSSVAMHQPMVVHVPTPFDGQNQVTPKVDSSSAPMNVSMSGQEMTMTAMPSQPPVHTHHMPQPTPSAPPMAAAPPANSAPAQVNGPSAAVIAAATAPSAGSVATIGQIGQLLDNVVMLANNARDMFKQGEHGVSSNCLGDLQRSLARIGELGSQSLATVQADLAAASLNSTPEQTRTQDQQQQQSDGMQSALPSPTTKKRPMQLDEAMGDQPFKSMRSDNSTPLHPPPAPPSAPPVMMANPNLIQEPPTPSRSAPPIQHSATVPQVPRLQTLGSIAQPTPFHNQNLNGALASQSHSASPTTPQTPFELSPQSQPFTQSMAPGMATQSMPPSPLSRQGHMRHASLQDAMPPSNHPMAGDVMSADKGRISRAALQMSSLTNGGSSGQQSALDSGATTPDESHSNGDSFDEAVGQAEQRHLIKHRRHRSSGPFSSGASFDFGHYDNGNDDSMGGDKAGGGTALTPELRNMLEQIFHAFLTAVCSNLEATDDRGELLHQTLMPKKMARLDESPDFRPFKFRIQAFTNAFQSEVYRRGISEADCSIKKIKQFLWTQPYISRFNEDGKKAKSKGNHIWIVEAKKIPEGRWEFREFTRKIAGAPEKIAYVGLKWAWPLRVWDPQASSSSIKAVFSANQLPSWINWEEGQKVLSGIPDANSESGEISITAHDVHAGQLHQLQHSFFLQVATLTSDDLNLPNPEANPVDLQDLSNGLAGDATASTSQSGQQQQAMQMSYPVESIKYEVVDPSKVPAVLSAISFPFTPPVHQDARQQYMNLDAAVLSTSQHSEPQAQPPQLTSEDIHAHQVRNIIEHRQQEQASSFMLSIPSRKNSFSSAPTGQGTPMSSMPAELASTLPANTLSPAMPVNFNTHVP